MNGSWPDRINAISSFALGLSSRYRLRRFSRPESSVTLQVILGVFAVGAAGSGFSVTAVSTGSSIAAAFSVIGAGSMVGSLAGLSGVAAGLTFDADSVGVTGIVVAEEARKDFSAGG